MKKRKTETKFKFFDNTISPERDLVVDIIIQFRIMHEEFNNASASLQKAERHLLIQNFIIMPNNITKYLQYETKIKSIILSQYINKLFIGSINENQLAYLKTKNYDSNVFDVYYEIHKNVVGVIGSAEEIESRSKPIQMQITIPKKFIIEESLLGKCESCLQNSVGCVYKKKHRGKGCPDWEQS